MEKGIYLNGKYTNLGVGKDVLYTEAEENRIKMKISDESTMLSAEYDYNGMADFLKLLENIDINMVKDMNLFGSGFNYIAADRLGPQSSYEKSYYEVWEQEQIGNHGEYAVHYLQTHESEEVENKNILYDEEPSRRLQRQVECWLGEITPGVSLRMEDYGHSNRIGLMVHQEGNIGAGLLYCAECWFWYFLCITNCAGTCEGEKGRINHSGESGSAFTSKRTEKNGRTDRQSSTGRCAGYCRNA